MYPLIVLFMTFLVTPLAVLAALRMLDGPAPGASQQPGFVGWVVQSKLWHGAVALVVSAFVFLALIDHHGEGWALVLPLILLAVLVMVVRAWRNQLLFLMSLHDDELPGHNDKLIWAILLILLPPVGLWLFRAYRREHWPEALVTKAQPVGEFS